MEQMLERAELEKALEFATMKHLGQCRKGATQMPYITHPVEVMEILKGVGKVNDFAVLQAALLHDTVENTDTTIADLKEIFGVEVARYVAEVTNDETLTQAEGKQLEIDRAGTLSAGAAQIRVADKTANVLSLSVAPPLNWSTERRLHYVYWAREVVRRCNPHNELLLLEFERACQQFIKRVERGLIGGIIEAHS